MAAENLTISVDIDARKTKAGAEQAKKNIKDVRQETDELKKSASASDRDVKGLTAQLGSLGKIAGPLSAALLAVGAAILAIGAAALKAAEAIFNLAKGFAAFAKEIYTANEVTGLSIELLSGLKVQADLVGRSFEEVLDAIKNFSKTIADANNGSKEASAKLQRLGIDAKKAASDLDGAFEQAIKKILSVREGVEQMAAATDAFGENGPKLLPFLKQFGGDLEQVKEKARELGLMLSVEDAKAAKEFNKSLAEVQAMLRSVAITFGREFLPVVRDVLTAVAKWFKESKETIQDWAVFSADAISGFITALDKVKNWIADNEFVVRFLLAATSFGTSELFIGAAKNFGAATNQLAAQGRQNRLNRPLAVSDDPSLQVPTRIPGVDYGDGYNYPPATQPGKQPKTRGRAAGISDEQRQAEQLAEQLKRLQLEVQFFGDNSRGAAVSQQLMASGVYASNKAIADQIVLTARQLDELDAAKKKTDEYKASQEKLKQELASREAGIITGARGTQYGLEAELQELQQQIALGRELTIVERQSIANITEKRTLMAEMAEAGFEQKEIDRLVEILVLRQKDNLEILKKIQSKRDLIAAEEAYKRLISGLDSEIADLTAQLAEYTTGLQATRVEILLNSEAYKKLGAEEQKAALARAQQIDGLREAIKAQEEARAAYEDFYDTIRNGLETLAEQGFGAFFKNVMRMFQSFLIDLAAKWLTSKFFNMFFKGGNQQAASSSGSGGGNIFGAIQQAIFGGGTRGSSGQVSGGTPPFNPGYFTGGSGSGLDFGNLGSILHSTQDTTSRSGGGGGFGGRSVPGAVAGISVGANIIGGMIGGRWGNIASLAGTGLGIGWSIGGPIGGAIGAAIGGVAGLLMGIFGGDPKRKRDKNEKMPQLTRGFTDALAELRALVADVRTLRVSPEGAISRATELRNAIASGFGIQFESNKYRRQAQTLIASRLAEADQLIIELRKAAEVATAAGERDRRILPEFASGVFMGRTFAKQFEQFKQRNGLLPGIFTGGDTLPSMLAPGEMVLNPAQQSRVRSNAGMDPFVGAGIPGYGGSGSTQQQAAAGGDLHVSIFLEQDASGMWIATAKSPDGKKVIADVVQEKFRSDEIKTSRRGV